MSSILFGDTEPIGSIESGGSGGSGGSIGSGGSGGFGDGSQSTDPGGHVPITHGRMRGPKTISLGGIQDIIFPSLMGACARHDG